MMCVGRAWTMNPAPPVSGKADAAFLTYPGERAMDVEPPNVPSETLCAQQLSLWVETAMLEAGCSNHSLTHSYNS
jgi:hypothetical protein